MKDVRKYISWSNDAKQRFFVVPSFLNSVLGKLFQQSSPAYNLWVWGTPVSRRWGAGSWSNIKMSFYQYRIIPITFYRIISGECAVPGLYASFCFLWFTNCVLLSDKSLILGCLWPLVFVLHNILILGIWCSTIPHLPGCFCPWTFFENIGFNTVLTDPFMSHLATQLGYSAGEFQALQLIVLAAFGVVD